MKTIRARLYDKIPGRLFLRLPSKWQNHILNMSGSVTVLDGDSDWDLHRYWLTDRGEQMLFTSREAD